MKRESFGRAVLVTVVGGVVSGLALLYVQGTPAVSSALGLGEAEEVSLIAGLSDDGRRWAGLGHGMTIEAVQRIAGTFDLDYAYLPDGCAGNLLHEGRRVYVHLVYEQDVPFEERNCKVWRGMYVYDIDIAFGPEERSLSRPDFVQRLKRAVPVSWRPHPWRPEQQEDPYAVNQIFALDADPDLVIAVWFADGGGMSLTTVGGVIE